MLKTALLTIILLFSPALENVGKNHLMRDYPNHEQIIRNSRAVMLVFRGEGLFCINQFIVFDENSTPVPVVVVIYNVFGKIKEDKNWCFSIMDGDYGWIILPREPSAISIVYQGVFDRIYFPEAWR